MTHEENHTSRAQQRTKQRKDLKVTARSSHLADGQDKERDPKHDEAEIHSEHQRSRCCANHMLAGVSNRRSGRSHMRLGVIDVISL
jgi:hypothetical protein